MTGSRIFEVRAQRANLCLCFLEWGQILIIHQTTHQVGSSAGDMIYGIFVVKSSMRLYRLRQGQELLLSLVLKDWVCIQSYRVVVKLHDVICAVVSRVLILKVVPLVALPRTVFIVFLPEQHHCEHLFAIVMSLSPLMIAPYRRDSADWAQSRHVQAIVILLWRSAPWRIFSDTSKVAATTFI